MLSTVLKYALRIFELPGPSLDPLFIFCIEEFFAKQEWHNSSKAPYLFSRVGLFGVKGRVFDGRIFFLSIFRFFLPNLNESAISELYLRIEFRRRLVNDTCPTFATR